MDITNYTKQLSSLNTAKTGTSKAPHKAILLLTVIDLIDWGEIKSNHIKLDDNLEWQFKHNWSRYVGNSPLFQSKIATPYWHMQGESFWKLILQDGRETTKDNFQGSPYSVSNLKKQVRYAAIDQDLFELMQTVDGRAQMRTLLISIYLTYKPIQKENLLTLLITFGGSLFSIAS